MKATITQDPSTGRVTLSYDCPINLKRMTREFTVRDAPFSYVREIHPNGTTTQPCDLLGSRGNTLVCSNGRADLLPLIRSELAALRRQFKRDGY